VNPDDFRTAALAGQAQAEEAIRALRATLSQEQDRLLDDLLGGISAHQTATHEYVVAVLVEALPGVAGAIRDLADLAAERCLG